MILKNRLQCEGLNCCHGYFLTRPNVISPGRAKYTRKLVLQSQMGSFAFSSSLIQVVFYPEEAKTPGEAE